MTCEEYAISKLIEKEKECEELKTEVRDLQEDVHRLTGELNKFGEMFRKFCKQNIFETTGTKEFELTVRSYSFDDDCEKYYKWIESKFPELSVKVYPNTCVSNTEDEE